MRILYVGMKYDYGNPELGHSFEHWNFFHCLRAMGHEVLYFDFMTLMQERARDWMNRRLAEVAAAEQPDLMFTVLFQDQLDQQVVRNISQGGKTLTFNWFCDDHWRFDNFSRHWAPCFNFVATTAQSALPKYEGIGYHNVIKTQWACNPFLYRRLDLPLKYDVSFVGRPHGNRVQIIEAMRQAGIEVCTWGDGWPSGPISQDEMIRVFNQSRINLNLSNASIQSAGGTGRIRRVVRHVVSRSARAILGNRLKAMVKQRRKDRLRSTTISWNKVEIDLRGQQIKGRNFEVPGCGGFLLTGMAENLGDYFTPNREVGCFGSMQELVEKTRHYLANDADRASLADAGYRKTIVEHTYVHRFCEIFQRMGLGTAMADSMLYESRQSRFVRLRTTQV